MSAEGIKRRGFASMDRARHRELSSRGGKASASQGKGHRFTPESGRAAGEKGRQTPRACRRCRQAGHNILTCTEAVTS